jgi:Putative peptidoglycan binding domain
MRQHVEFTASRRIEMKKTLCAMVAAALLYAPSVKAEEIVWDQPQVQSAAPDAQYGLHENLNFEGNAKLKPKDVRKLQMSLREKGFYKGPIDGLWGGKTTQALLDYQGVNEQALTGTVTVGTLSDLGVNVRESDY